MMANLEGRSALMTGASQGIGRACALELAGQGATVWLAARNEDALRAVADEIATAGGQAKVTRLDLSDADAIAEGLAPVLAEGGVDVLVNNAGITDDGLFVRMKDEQWQRVLDTNLTGTMRVTRTLLKPMMKKRWGRIVLITSVVGQMGNPGQSNYAAAKAGMMGFGKALAREIASRGITVNSVAPGYIETAMTAELNEGQREALLTSVPAGRMGTPEDVASAVSWLSSEGAGYVTGHVLAVKGGMYT
jgi:3-oxoacyl-[acyl-carrier protein] reductase